jgi:hypothetical protein
MTQALRPNLFIIGAMKSGTTSLHEYLDTHPQIVMSQEKEPGYFVEQLGLHKGEEWYFSRWTGVNGQHRYRGESSTHYTKLPVFQGVPERLYRFNPEARLIYIMRNPFDRIVSHYWHAVRDAYHGGELRPLLRAVKEDPGYLSFSDYATQLEPYFDRFGRGAVLTLTFEALLEDPQREIDRIYTWLGLPSHPIGNKSGKAHNQKPKDITAVAGAGILNRIQYSSAWDRISPHVPAWLKDLAEQEVEKDISRLREAIAELQLRQVDRLTRLLGRDFPEWRAQKPKRANAQAVSQSM